MQKYLSLTCLNAFDPLPALGRKVEPKKQAPIDTREKLIRDFETKVFYTPEALRRKANPLPQLAQLAAEKRPLPSYWVVVGKIRRLYPAGTFQREAMNTWLESKLHQTGIGLTHPELRAQFLRAFPELDL